MRPLTYARPPPRPGGTGGSSSGSEFNRKYVLYRPYDRVNQSINQSINRVSIAGLYTSRINTANRWLDIDNSSDYEVRV